MKFLSLTLALCLVAAPSFAQNPVLDLNNSTVTTPGTTLPRNLAARFSDVLYASDYGMVADGVTSDDAALNAALTACTARGAKLILPAGKILLTGVQTSTVASCGLVGSNTPGGTAAAPTGTTFLMTSTTVGPFLLKADWSFSGINFYWPNQTNGVTAYPPLFSDGGTQCVAHASLDHVTIINAYDGFVGTANCGWGNVIISNSTMYAVHDLFRLSRIGDSILIGNTSFAPGPWLQICNFSTPCLNALNAADQVNTIFHATAGGTLNINVDSNSYAEGWRFAIFLDAGSVIAESNFRMNYDGVATFIDSSSGGRYAYQNDFSAPASNCSTAVWIGPGTGGNFPCFNMGANSSLVLNDFQGAARGDFIRMNGGSVQFNNVSVADVGSIQDGGDYYLLHVIGAGSIVTVRDSTFSAHPGDVHVHGITTGTNVPLTMTVQHNSFIYFNDVMDIQSASNQPSMIVGNVSQATTGAATIAIRGSNQVMYANNVIDKPPLATLSACGSGATAHGAFSGFINIGSTNPTTSCQVTLPWTPYGQGGGACVFSSPNTTVITSGGPAGVVWTLNFSGDAHGNNIFFNCPGQQ